MPDPNRKRALIRCPFFVEERRHEGGRRRQFFYCEFCRFQFPDAAARREIVYGICCDPDSWQACTIYKMSSAYYERLFKQQQQEERR